MGICSICGQVASELYTDGCDQCRGATQWITSRDQDNLLIDVYPPRKYDSWLEWWFDPNAHPDDEPPKDESVESD